MAKKKDTGDAPIELLEPAAGPAPTGQGIRLSAHPRARRHIAMAKGWGGLIAFVVVLKLSLGAGLPWPDALERAVIGGVLGYVVAWAIVQTIWRHVALAELEQLRTRLVAMADQQAAARQAAIAEAEAAAAAARPVPQG